MLQKLQQPLSSLVSSFQRGRRHLSSLGGCCPFSTGLLSGGGQEEGGGRSKAVHRRFMPLAGRLHRCVKFNLQILVLTALEKGLNCQNAASKCPKGKYFFMPMKKIFKKPFLFERFNDIIDMLLIQICTNRHWYTDTSLDRAIFPKFFAVEF